MADVLWAPWRLTYIEKTSSGAGTGDIFVDLPAEHDDAKNLILFRGATCFVMMNAFPYCNGHLLIAPYRQVADLDLMTDSELLEINQLLARATKWLRHAYQPHGFNIGVNVGRAAGAGVPIHIHWHILPRWNGDVNFMTTVADVRVIPQSLSDSYDRLQESIHACA